MKIALEFIAKESNDREAMLVAESKKKLIVCIMLNGRSDSRLTKAVFSGKKVSALAVHPEGGYHVNFCFWCSCYC